MFANTDINLSVYGSNIYQFNLKPNAKIMDISNDAYELIRANHAYRAGLFDAARFNGVDVVRRKNSPLDHSYVVLNFDVIKAWKII